MRTTDNERCAVCIENLITPCCAADLSDDPNDRRTHLQFMYDLRLSRHTGREDFSHALEVYALNRYLAPFRDNKNKKEGKQANRTVRSRNVRTSDLLSKKCHVRRGAVQCMRNAGHPDEDGKGGHKF